MTQALTGPEPVRGGVRFTVEAASAKTVSVAGSFNQWSTTSHPLHPSTRHGLWSGVIPLPPGEHLFMYVVDGTHWVSPPLAEDHVDDGFGAQNGVVVVR